MTMTSSQAAADNSNKGRQIPIVCPGHTRPLAELQFCHVADEQRTLLVSACHDSKPMLRDGATGDWIGTFAGHKGAVWSCKLDPTGSLAATASGDFSVQVWDAITGKSLYQFTHASHIVKTCDFSPDSQWLAVGGHEGILRIYNLNKPKQAPLEIRQDAQDKIVISKCCWWTHSILLAGCADGVIRFWQIDVDNDGSSWKSGSPPSTPLYTIRTDAEIRDMEITTTTTKQQILTVAAGSHVYFYNLADQSLIHKYKMPIHFQEEGGASLHISGTKFIAGGSDLWVRVFDFETGQELECLRGHHGPIRCLRYSPDGKTYASGSEDGTIRLWKTNPEESS